MKRFIMLIGVMFVGALGLVMPSSAGLLVEEIDRDIFFVSYERGRWTSATVLDTASKARRKIEKLSHRYCLEEGYLYLRFPTLGEISRDENLRAAWELGAGDEASDSFLISGGEIYLVNKAHKTRRILILANAPGDGFEACTDR